MAHLLFWIFIAIGILLCLAYMQIIGSYCYGWLMTKSFDGTGNASVFVSVIVPARNEEQTIIQCLEALVNQNYPALQFEIIVVDDASTDSTNARIRQFCSNHNNVRLITLADEQGGKKNAIREAIEIAKGELIVTTDADCTMGVGWLNAIAVFYNQTQAKMIVAPVSFYDEKTIFQKMQSLEFMALVVSSGASLFFNKAIMCNGANLAYTKKVFYEVNGFEGIDKNASGDDVLLMYKIKRLYPKGILFLKNTNAMVLTKAKSGIKDFTDQRRRWASKGFKALNAETRYVALIVYLYSFFFLLSPLIFFSLPDNSLSIDFLKISLIILGIKVFIDFLLLFLAGSFFKKRHFLIYFLPEQFLYMLYIVLIGLPGIKGKFKWKDRKIY